MPITRTTNIMQFCSQSLVVVPTGHSPIGAQLPPADGATVLRHGEECPVATNAFLQTWDGRPLVSNASDCLRAITKGHVANQVPKYIAWIDCLMMWPALKKVLEETQAMINIPS